MLLENSDSKYMFGPHELHPECIFHKTNHSMAFVNRKPVVPGRILKIFLFILYYNHLEH